jgi:hypothetical protein
MIHAEDPPIRTGDIANPAPPNIRAIVVLDEPPPAITRAAHIVKRE